MPLQLKVSATAFRDIDHAVNYYRQQKKGLGKQFMSDINTLFTRIQQFPHAASFAYEDVRYKVMNKFPFIILYEFDDVSIYILRVFNTHLQPQF